MTAEAPTTHFDWMPVQAYGRQDEALSACRVLCASGFICRVREPAEGVSEPIWWLEKKAGT